MDYRNSGCRRGRRLACGVVVAAVLVGGCQARLRGSQDDPGHVTPAPDLGGFVFTDDAGAPSGVPAGLAIDPPSATLDLDGVKPGTLQLTPLLTYTGGGNAPTQARWWLDRPSLATIDDQGRFTALGTLGGEVKVTAVYQGFTAQATIAIKVHYRANPGKLSQAERDALANGGAPDKQVTWAYPYDGTVFPQGLAPPDLMWNGGGANDRYRVWLEAPFADAEILVNAAPPARVVLDDLAWRPVTRSFHGGTLKLVVTRKAGGTVTTIARMSFTIAAGQARGSVYYWANNLGRVLRIKPGARAPDDFLQASGIIGCSTCHSVSANGRRLALGGDVDASTYDLKQAKAVLSGKGRSWAMPALSPDGDVLVMNNAPLPGPPGGAGGAFDATTGLPIPNTGLEGLRLWMPAFAPDGKLLAYVGSADKDLRLFDWSAASRRATRDRTLVAAGNDPSVGTIAFPTVSPDHKWVVYQRGSNGSYDTRSGTGDLYLNRTSAPGGEIRLARLNGDKYPFAAGDRDRHANYEPTLAPVPSGGFFWVVFTSRRTYGNLLNGGAGAVKQLWVAAIDANGPMGGDPSHPAFWLPGQDPMTLNMRGFWALDPCKNDGQACDDGSECCSGYCDSHGDGGGPVCGPNGGGCSQVGNKCVIDADCCQPGGVDPGVGDVHCIGGICDEQAPG